MVGVPPGAFVGRTEGRRTTWLHLVGLLAAGALAAYVAGGNAAFWLWVANSAFRGIREPVDVPLGVQSVAFALVPPAVGAVTWLWHRRKRHPLTPSTAWSLLCASVAALPFVLLAATASVI